MFKVVAAQCDQCLFSPNRIVSAARAKDVCCRGFYDRDPGASNLMRIAGRLGAVEFVDVEEKGPAT